MISEPEGAAAVSVARAAIARGLSEEAPKDAAEPFRRADLPPLFDEPRGTFVTLTRRSDGALRGCIGFPLPVFPLRVAVPRAAVAAAFEDPRFPPLRSRELEATLVEVSVLTVPEPIDSADPAVRLRSVVVGRDGLIVDSDRGSGLLLPQVATDEGWDARTFLAQTCRKAGLRSEAWTDPSTRWRRFQADVFSESAPGGAVRRHR